MFVDIDKPVPRFFFFRFDEVLQLKIKHVRFHRPGPAVPQRFYVYTITLPFRHSDGPSQRNGNAIKPSVCIKSDDHVFDVTNRFISCTQQHFLFA